MCAHKFNEAPYRERADTGLEYSQEHMQPLQSHIERESRSHSARRSGLVPGRQCQEGLATVEAVENAQQLC